MAAFQGSVLGNAIDDASLIDHNASRKGARTFHAGV